MASAIKVIGATVVLAAATLGMAWHRGAADGDSIERGRYIARIAACNDCHTPGYIEAGGNVPETVWLTGNTLGWSGDWGTTYPPNLRHYMQRVTEDEWVRIAHSVQLRPPMPWFILHDLSEADLRAFYRFVRYLGPAGQAAPAYLPPEQTAAEPTIQFPRAAAQAAVATKTKEI
jgi:hypothetical protein